jgi:hypothetical protein
MPNAAIITSLYVCEFNCPTDFAPVEKMRDNDPYVA